MCGRINVSDNEGVRLLLAMLGMDTWPAAAERYNIPPTSLLDGVLQADPMRQARLRWGLTPAWSQPAKRAAPLINARAETVREKASFRRLLPSQRAVIPVNGFYEWRREGKQKQAFYIQLADERACFLAGLYQPAPEKAEDDDALRVPGDQVVGEVCLLTVAANDTMAGIHHRMPLMLPVDAAGAWLAEDGDIDALLQPPFPARWQATAVSDYVNSARNEGPACVEAA